MNVPDSYNDDQQGFYLEQAQAILAAGCPEMLTEDHIQALQVENDNDVSQ